ncbi:MAG: hypothetical protein JWL59_856 [Chthoniobacteraceae bacterium]|nr:hypothetical protein [Chthoniobacteraceae bacterium]
MLEGSGIVCPSRVFYCQEVAQVKQFPLDADLSAKTLSALRAFDSSIGPLTGAISLA